MGTFTEEFTNDTGFIYNSDYTEFSGGVMQQVDTRPANATFAATYTSSINANWGDGVLTGAATGGAEVSGGFLDLAHNDVRYVTYDADLNADSQQEGCFRILFNPNYSGTPATNQFIIEVYNAAGALNNRIRISHTTDGNLAASLYNSVSGRIINIVGAFSPTSGTSYEIEFNYDITAGASRLFLDGTQTGSTAGETGVRSSSISYFRVGADFNGNGASNFSIEEFILFSDVQHTANYTIGETINETIYLEDTISVPQFVYTDLGDIDGFTSFSTTESGNIKIVFNGEYWNGSAWVASDDSYAQANTAADINTNISTVDVSETIDLKIIWEAQNSANSIDILAIGYTSTADEEAPSLTTVFGYSYNPDGSVSQREIIITLSIDANEYSDRDQIRNKAVYVTPGTNGFWSVDLVDNTNMETGSYYEFKWGEKKENRVVPFGDSVLYNSLAEA